MMKIEIPERDAPIVCKDCVASTNTQIKELVPSGIPEGFVLAAERQTSGRGRLGRSFESPVGGLYLSMLLYPECPPEETATLTPCAAVAVSRAIEKVCGIVPEIKWPNDLQINGKKLCGILTESSLYSGKRYVVTGLGVNVNTDIAALPEDVRELATSVFNETGKRADIEKLASEIVRQLDMMYENWSVDKRFCVEEYRKKCNSIGCNIYLIRGDEKHEARSIDIDDSFALIVDEAGVRKRIDFGEISVRNK